MTETEQEHPYVGFRRDADAARAAFRWTGGAVRLAEAITDPIIRAREWGRVEKDEYTIPFGWGFREGLDDQPWVWRYGTASAGTGSRYAALVTRVHGDIASYEGGPVIVTVLAPWQDAWAVALDGWLDQSYVAEHLTAGRARAGRLHGGDLAALTQLLRILLGREDRS
jgi:hypothetical protein